MGGTFGKEVGNAIRSYYYTSVSGDTVKMESIKQILWNRGFHGEVFKKDRREAKAKGVDIALTKDILSHAFLGNYDLAVLVAGDGDYVPVIEEIRRLGKIVYVAFFEESGLSPNLRLASDFFFAMEGVFFKRWSEYVSRSK